ncbi:A/G-specific adenine glycosylase [Virgibacillus sp. W0430]|uniref:A/G-specific adenine glycosylase n=1 Tax=Virgibacillus sp. W0430 TaxID=3391580 RepID=UPI003F477710
MSAKELQDFNIKGFQQDLMDWYENNKRDLPWRRTSDPYKIWVSEIMLQQTKVDTVIPYFNRFIARFPTPQALADAEEQAVLKEWEGLGYYSRAKNFQHAVREVVASYDGVVPNNPDELGALKGIGPYTKGAILSIAFNQPVPAVDGNVMRVFSRILQIEENIAMQRVKKKFEEYVKQFVPTDRPSVFNQAVMELGALVCIPKTPQCLLCPVQSHCKAFRAGLERTLPVKSKDRKKKIIPYVVLLIKNKNNEYAVEKRSATGLLANMWQFLMVPIDEIGMDHIEHWVYGEYGLKIKLKGKKEKLKHVFSHLVWELDIYEAKLMEENKANDLLFKSKEEMELLPFSVSHSKIKELITE